MALDIREKFDPAVYEHIGLDELTTYAIYSLIQKSKEATSENIVAEAFMLFPRRFSLRGHPEWPDSAVVNKSWWRCKTDKGYVVGSVKEGFKLTPQGIRVAKDIEERLTQSSAAQVQGKNDKAELRTREGKLLRQLEESHAFKLFAHDSSFNIDEFALKDAIFLPPDASKSSIRRNLEQLRTAARLYQRQDISKFLDCVESRLL